MKEVRGKFPAFSSPLCTAAPREPNWENHELRERNKRLEPTTKCPIKKKEMPSQPPTPPEPQAPIPPSSQPVTMPASSVSAQEVEDAEVDVESYIDSSTENHRKPSECTCGKGNKTKTCVSLTELLFPY